MSNDKDKNVPDESVDDALNENDPVASDSTDRDSTDAVSKDSASKDSASKDSAASDDAETSTKSDEVELDRNGEPLSEKAKARRAAREKAAAEAQGKSRRRGGRTSSAGTPVAGRAGGVRDDEQDSDLPRYVPSEADSDNGDAQDADSDEGNTGIDERPAPASHSGLAHKLYSGEVSYDFVGRRKKFFAISAIIMVICFAFLGFKQLNLGIEFKGGADFQAPTQVNAQTVEQVTNAVQEAGVPDLDETTISTIGDGTVRVQTRSLNTQEVQAVRGAIAEQVGIESEQVAYSLVGASWGQQITTKGGIALVVFLVLVMALIWIYFRDLKMSIAAIVALLHDLVLTIGVYAIVGFTVTPATLIGVLTILGYSLYDTVVVFDKVRENVADLRGRTYGKAANLAVNQVLVRSINTTIIGVLPVAALLAAGWFILGTGPLKDLGLALFVGMIAGAYSSIFIAAPLLVAMKNREPGHIAHASALERRASGKGGTAPSELDGEQESGDGSGSRTLASKVAVTVSGASTNPGQPANRTSGGQTRTTGEK